MNRFDLTTPNGPPAQRRTYQSVDSVVQGEQKGVYRTEFLNSLSMSRVPPHTLTLQEGCPVILLRNMPSGLANGTRLIVVKLMQHIIDVEITTGPDKGRRVFIPHLNITPFDTKRMPFTLCRRQFPLRPAFAMTINKAQGQTLQTVGVYLPKPVFCHGQLYVAFFRCDSWRGVRVLVRGGSMAALNGAPAGVYTSNVVYREVLQWFFLWVWGSSGSPLDSLFFSRAWALVSSKGMGWIRLKWGFYIYQTFRPCMFSWGTFQKQ